MVKTVVDTYESNESLIIVTYVIKLTYEVCDYRSSGLLHCSSLGEMMTTLDVEFLNWANLISGIH